MTDQTVETLAPPRFDHAGPMRIAGLSQTYTGGDIAGIPAQWQRFVPWLGAIPGQTGFTTYGLCTGSNESLDYVCGVEVSDAAMLPAELSDYRVPQRKYAVFTHSGHVSAIGGTWNAIFNRWLPGSGMKMASAPQYERYTEAFNPATGMGDVEIWIPIE